jgi:hypothetical protein
LFVFILAVCCIAYRLPEGNLKYAGAFLLFLCFAGLSFIRINTMQKASVALEDYLFAGNLVPPGSTVLPLIFSVDGKTREGAIIAKRNSIFRHAADYMGADQQLIIFDNYEANIGYFPVNWKTNINPYIFLSKEQGIEGIPPCADMSQYQKKTGVAVDYIAMWCYEPSYLADPNFRTFYEEIERNYQLVYSSPTKRSLLYQRRPQMLNVMAAK